MLETNVLNQSSKEKGMKIIKIISIILVLLLILAIAIGIMIYMAKQKEFKVIIDGDNKTSKFSSDAFIVDGEDVYVSIKDMSTYLKYTYNKGEYKKYSEDENSCYIQNDNEVVNFVKDNTEISKIILSESVSADGTGSTSTTTSEDIKDGEYYILDKAIMKKNDKLYADLAGISKACNISIQYTKKDNSLQIYTLPYLVKYYANKFTNASLNDKDSIFSNQKALLYNLIIVKNTKGLYGVNDLNGTEIIGQKYTSIKFTENNQEFLVKTEEGKMGIISKDGKTKISPIYDSIKQIDKEDGLYIVSNDKKYGIVNKNGKTVLYIEYEEIGIDNTKFPYDDITNRYILYGNIIPVKKTDKWGFVDKTGKTIVEPTYSELGCIISNSQDQEANNNLLVPEYEGIVVQKDSLYGLINSTGKELIPCYSTDFYVVNNAGKNSYYTTYKETTTTTNTTTNPKAVTHKIDVIDYLQNTLGLQPISHEKINVTTNTTNSNVIINNTNTSANVETNTQN